MTATASKAAPAPPPAAMQQPSAARRSPRSERTRAALIAAATDVFRSTSFHDAKITDIAAAAGVAHGSFYTHFSSKEEVFLAVLDGVMAEGFIATAVRRDLGPEATPAEQIEAGNDRYFEFFRKNGKVLASMETLAPSHPLIEQKRVDSVLAYTYRAAASITRWRRQAGATSTVSPEVLAYCLSAMVERISHLRFTLNDDNPADEVVLAALTSIWTAAIGIT